jgi:osmotically-inducible protein OsmY
VTLTGTVQRAERKARAAELARQVKGVRRVKNDLEIRADPAP